MPRYTHLDRSERDQIAELKAAGHRICAIARALNRDPSTISRELRRNSCEQGAYRPTFADGSYLYRRQRAAILEKDQHLRAFVVDRLAEGWTPEQIAGWLGRGIERGLRAISFEAIYAFIFRAAQKAEKLWRYLARRKATLGRRARRSKDRITDKTHISQRSKAANDREEPGHWEADLVICKRNRPLLVLHERKTRLTVMTRLTSKSAAETVTAITEITEILAKLDPKLRRSIESAFATIRHRTKRSKGCLSRGGMLHMMFKLGQCAEQNWRKLRGFDYLAKVITGVVFKDGIENTNPDQIAA